MPFMREKAPLDIRLAVITGVIVAVASYFNLFAIPTSFVTRDGCIKSGGTITESHCTINQVELEIKG